MDTVKKRLPRYQRAKNPPRILRLAHYFPLLELIQEYRFLDSEQIIALSGISRTNSQAKLQKLYHNGLVERYFLPTTEILAGTRKFIYTLDCKGARLLTEQKPELFKNIYYPKRRRSLHFVEHTLMVSNFRACLTVALKDKPELILKTWKQGHEIKKEFQKYDMGKAGVVPDGYFVLANTEKEYHFFLEADRGTMSLGRFYEKVNFYRKFFNAYRKDLPPCFLVVTIAPSDRRAENLRTVTINGDPQKQGSARFWFASEKQYTLANPQTILEPIFKVGLYEMKMKRSLYMTDGDAKITPLSVRTPFVDARSV